MDKFKKEVARATGHAAAYVKGGTDGVNEYKERNDAATSSNPSTKKAGNAGHKVTKEVTRMFDQSKNAAHGAKQGVQEGKGRDTSNIPVPEAEASSAPRPN